MKTVIYILAFTSYLFGCNAANGKSENTNSVMQANHVSNDSSAIVNSNTSWQKLLNLNNQMEQNSQNENSDTFVPQSKQSNKENMKEITLGAGCFWCIEACFLDIKGIISVVPGYAGGKVKNPTYEQVCTGSTGHAEVARIVYDETIISFDEILEMFWFVHDPTQLNRQGNDIGTQYRSVVFYHSEEQKEIAEKYKARLTEEKVWDKPIVTEIVAINNYYEAEKYHHNYLEQNPENAYCRAIVRPKVDKFKKVFESKIK